jgi:hypothetical protein
MHPLPIICLAIFLGGCVGDNFGQRVTPDSFSFHINEAADSMSLMGGDERRYGISLNYSTGKAERIRRRFDEDLTREGFRLRVEDGDLTLRRPPRPIQAAVSLPLEDRPDLGPNRHAPEPTTSSPVTGFFEVFGVPPPKAEEGGLGVLQWGVGVLAAALAFTIILAARRKGHPDPPKSE